MVAEDKANTSEVIKKTLLRLFSVKNIPLDILEKESSLDKLKKEIERKLEREKRRYDLFLYQEKDFFKAEQCRSYIDACKEMFKIIDEYKWKEIEDLEETCWYILECIKEFKESEE
jgi:hypothetical protein